MGLVTVFGAASCADFLEVEPKDRVTGNALLSSDGGINAYMAGHYYNLPIEELMAVILNFDGELRIERMVCIRSQ